MFRNKQALKQTRLCPISVMFTVLKDAFAAVLGCHSRKNQFKYLQHYSLINDELN
jgi:hypothetical protein